MCVNEMLTRMEKESYIPDFLVNFASRSNPSELNGVYCKDGVTGMLDTKNYKCLDTIFPFVEAFIDRCCGETYGPLTSICALYNDILRCSLHREYSPSWNTSSLQSLKNMINFFQKFMLNIFEEYHPSGLKPVKFHMLSHLHEDIKHIGDLRMVDVQFYENQHLTFKQECKRTSQRRG